MAPRTRKPRDDPLQAQLAELGMEIQKTIGDGNCLFRAFSSQLFDTDEKHGEIRAAVVQFMKENPADFKWFAAAAGDLRRAPKRKNRRSGPVEKTEVTEAEVDEAYEKYLSKMAKNREWGGNQELLAFAKSYNTTVRLYQLGQPHQDYSAPESSREKVRIVHILYHNGNHYSSVIPVKGEEKEGKREAPEKAPSPSTPISTSNSASVSTSTSTQTTSTPTTTSPTSPISSPATVSTTPPSSPQIPSPFLASLAKIKFLFPDSNEIQAKKALEKGGDAEAAAQLLAAEARSLSSGRRSVERDEEEGDDEDDEEDDKDPVVSPSKRPRRRGRGLPALPDSDSELGDDEDEKEDEEEEEEEEEEEADEADEEEEEDHASVVSQPPRSSSEVSEAISFEDGTSAITNCCSSPSTSDNDDDEDETTTKPLPPQQSLSGEPTSSLGTVKSIKLKFNPPPPSSSRRSPQARSRETSPLPRGGRKFVAVRRPRTRRAV
ncbi:hypothetical protein BP5796_05316 [Coleophoma crateriformis]|uniref:OTU domain-containing protein n=1 Tax=Coleophoma crateriformis TaxID=565419 RepID=A0A3D8S2X5_9HELO|nr:hypothetical protein BP5796_05316 [Coleophoma crateriformis]